MSIDCCKSYVGKQIIGLLPSNGSQPPAQKCLYYALTSNCNGPFQGFLLEIDGSIYPNASTIYEVGTSIQSVYQLDAGGYMYNGFGNDIKLWSLENNPITSNWKIFNYDTLDFEPVSFALMTCDLKQRCWEVDIPDSGSILQFILNGEYPFDNQEVITGTGLTTSDPAFPVYLQSLFGGQAIITVNDNGSSCYIKIENCYDAIRPKSISVNFINYGFTEVDCV